MSYSLYKVIIQFETQSTRFKPWEVLEELVDATDVTITDNGTIIAEYNVPVVQTGIKKETEAYRRVRNLIEAHLDYIGINAEFLASVTTEIESDDD